MNNEQIKSLQTKLEKITEILDRISWREKQSRTIAERCESQFYCSFPSLIAKYRKQLAMKLRMKLLMEQEVFNLLRTAAPHDFSGLPTDHLFIHLIKESDL